MRCNRGCNSFRWKRTMFQGRSKFSLRKDEGYSKTTTPTLIPCFHYRRFSLSLSSTDTTFPFTTSTRFSPPTSLPSNFIRSTFASHPSPTETSPIFRLGYTRVCLVTSFEYKAYSFLFYFSLFFSSSFSVVEK